ncbi:MAG: NADH:flavin oxidoreductase [Candidatus Bathyarchaeota archaeon]|nr:MAG: NADH:flavin oxidoreductase [Candidatus Bathyarchaeota archaeon]
MPTLLDPIEIGLLRLKNRIVMPPMATGLATTEGAVTDELIKHYVRRAKALGLLIIEHSYVERRGKLSSQQLGIFHDNLIPGLIKLTARVHAAGTPIAMQINHAGRVTTSEICGAQPVAPSPISHSEEHETPRALSKEEIEGLVEAFGYAARRAVESGFDAVEIHGAHGFLLNQFFSPLSNKRGDEYGGRLEDRMRFPLQVVNRVKRKIGNLSLLYRLSADDMKLGGVSLDESKVVAQRLVEKGVDAIDVSGGMIGSRPEMLQGTQGYFVPLAEEIKSVVDVPVIGVGGIKTAEFANEIIVRGRTDLIAVGRAFLADAEWASKAVGDMRARVKGSKE